MIYNSADFNKTDDFDNKMAGINNNIKYLLDLLIVKLASNGKAKSTDNFGNTIYVDVNVFSNDQLINFLTLSLSEFNQTPNFTNFKFDDTDFVHVFADILVEGAALQALAVQALKEKSREQAFQEIQVADFIKDQHNVLLGFHIEKLRQIKINFKFTETKW